MECISPAISMAISPLLYDQYLQPDWRERYQDPRIWDLVDDIPDQELWEAHRRRKRRLINFVRERMVRFSTERKASNGEIRRLAEVLDPNAFTIGFARRFATYKRATLLFRDENRLKKLLTNPDMPVQIVIAGKAHPKDHPGKTLIRDIVSAVEGSCGFEEGLSFSRITVSRWRATWCRASISG